MLNAQKRIERVSSPHFVIRIFIFTDLRELCAPADFDVQAAQQSAVQHFAV
jgi:hypothetical protein